MDQAQMLDDGDDGIDKLTSIPIKSLAGVKPKEERKKEVAAPVQSLV